MLEDPLVEPRIRNESGRVLVVDDLPANVRLLRTHLDHAGYTVLEAEGGEEALELLQQHDVDVVLLDVMMPRLDGFETCRRIKADERTRHVPVVLVTSLTEVGDKIRGQEAGADDFISKPFDSVELLLRVKSLARIKSLHDQLLQRNSQLQQAQSQLQMLADTDPLTALHNKRYLEEFLLREIGKAARYERPLALVLVDIDRFKQVNDTRGHPTGDLLLQQISTLFRARIRRTDLAARYGGDEFVLVLSESGKTDAAAVAEGLRATVADYQFRDGNSQTIDPITISIGVASFPEDAQLSVELFAAADRRLYRAKQAGRNRVCASDD